ncbi:MAG: response regulator [Terriglobales bacterium]
MSNTTILLVEDDAILRRACALGLEQRGWRVIAAEDGERALSLAFLRQPALILLDLLMPKLAGLEALRLLRADTATREIPVFILSNSLRESDRDEARRLGAQAYFVKSDFSLQKLAAAIAQQLDGAPPEVDA